MAIEIGNYNALIADEFTEHGLFLVSEHNPGRRLLLPGVELRNKEIKIGDNLSLFVYLDSENRPTATLVKPKLTIFSFAYLEIISIGKHGAFVDWGLPKDLFIPYSELDKNAREGDWVPVFLYFDDQSNRLVGSTKVDAILNREKPDWKVGQEVEALVWRRTDLGFKLILDNQFEGMLFTADIIKPIRVGDSLPVYIKLIREDNKIDVSLQKIGMDLVKDDAFKIYGMLMSNDGVLPYSDKTDPMILSEVFGMSKKQFKRAVGTLYKSGKVVLEPDRIIKAEPKKKK
jgi:predicted RNA-binding protein (virulence factor B family)